MNLAFADGVTVLLFWHKLAGDPSTELQQGGLDPDAIGRSWRELQPNGQAIPRRLAALNMSGERCGAARSA